MRATLNLPDRSRREGSLIRRYDAELLSQRSIDGNGFRVESATRNVAGRREFDVLFPQHLLVLTLDGRPFQVEARLDGGPTERYWVRPGQLRLFPAGQRSCGHTRGVGTQSAVWLLVEPAFVAQASGADIAPSRLEVVRCTDLRNPAILHAMAALGREVERPGPMGRVYLESLVLVTLTELLRHHSSLAAARRPDDVPSRRLRRVIEYIDAHIEEDLSLLTLAALVGVGPAHLARAFKRAMGRPVHQYLLGRRVEWAGALLRATEQPISHIALAAGFSDQSHLTTTFRRAYGTTPAAYRRQLGR